MSPPDPTVVPCSIADIDAMLEFNALPPAEQQRRLTAAQKKQAAEDSLRQFVEQGWDVLEPGTTFIPGMHVDAVCLHLQALIENRIKDLAVNIPPGFAKSLIAAVFFPAWVWIKRPEYRFLYSSYKAEYATRDSVKCRTLIQSNWYQERWRDRFQLTIAQDHKFENSKTGYRETTSVATGTGARAMLVCVDDPTSVDQAASDAERNRANAWWTGTMTTRLNDLKTGHLLLIQQRLHEEDTTAVSIRAGRLHAPLPAQRIRSRPRLCHPRQGRHGAVEGPADQRRPTALAGESRAGGSGHAQAQAGQLRLLRAVSAAAESRGRRHLPEMVVALLDVQDHQRQPRAGPDARWHHAQDHAGGAAG
jgi:hypothetical protein